MKENNQSNEDKQNWNSTWSDYEKKLNAEIEAAGGRDAYTLQYRIKRYEDIKYSLESDYVFEEHGSREKALMFLEKYETLFLVYELFNQAGVNISFEYLDHVAQSHTKSRIEPMKKMLEEGAVEEATALYNKRLPCPR